MLEFLWIVPALPIAGFCILIMAGARLSPRWIAAIGTGSVGISAIAAIMVSAGFTASPPAGHFYSQTLWTWLKVSGLETGIAFYLDPLSIVMMLVVTIVGFLIHIYSVEYMKGEEGYSRFFAYMNLFVGSMLILVLADNLLFFYLGWEGVGLCSYLLIGFWYRDPANGYAARKAFIVTRIGDTALAIGLFLLYTNTGTLEIQGLIKQASIHWQTGSVIATAVALLILVGAIGKSAQVPLQTWLPDAMAGPTPVSALIHAATMVTAGVYLIARTNAIFVLAPVAQTTTAVIGAVTLLLAGCSALTQRDIKRVLAYSTISQIGYMFLALGVGAWSAAIFHFMVHAFFKALLFLAAGAIIISLDHEQDMFRMGGLRRQLPLVFWVFLIGSASLSAIPVVTAGFYSKDLILWEAMVSPAGNKWLWLAGITGAFLTSLYTFRMVFLTFFGEGASGINRKPSSFINIPLIVLAVLSIAGGFLETPGTLGGLSIFTDFLHPVLPAPISSRNVSAELVFQIIASLVSLSGVYAAYILFCRKSPEMRESVGRSKAWDSISRFWFSGWGFDKLYDILLVRPFTYLVRLNKDDFVDLLYSGIAWYSGLLNKGLSRIQSGKVRLYAASIAVGVILMLAIVVLK